MLICFWLLNSFEEGDYISSCSGQEEANIYWGCTSGMIHLTSTGRDVIQVQSKIKRKSLY